MDIHGQLLHAQLENSAADLTPASSGLTYFNTSTLFQKVYNGSLWKTQVDTDSVQTITNKYIPVVTGSSSAAGTLTLVSTDHATKGYIAVGGGNSFLFEGGSGASSFATMMAAHYSQTNVGFIFANTGSSTSSNMTLVADGANTCFIPTFNSRGTITAPTSLLTNDGIYQVNNKAWASATAQDFYAGQKSVGVIGMFANENHSTTNLGTRWEMTCVPNGTAARKTLWKSDGTLQFIIGDSTVSSGRNLIWNIDGSGNIGAASANRPDRIFAKTDVVSPSVKVMNPANTFSAEIKSPALLSSYSLTLPINDGSAGQVLTTDGSGILSWTAGGGGGGNTTAVTANWLAADGTSKSIVHGLGSIEVAAVTIMDGSTGQLLDVDTITVFDANQIDFTASSAPAIGWQVVITMKV